MLIVKNYLHIVRHQGKPHICNVKSRNESPPFAITFSYIFLYAIKASISKEKVIKENNVFKKKGKVNILIHKDSMQRTQSLLETCQELTYVFLTPVFHTIAFIRIQSPYRTLIPIHITFIFCSITTIQTKNNPIGPHEKVIPLHTFPFFYSLTNKKEGEK